MLKIHTGETANSLVAALADVLREFPPDPLTPEVVSVPTRGIERWISQELAQRLGNATDGSNIAANITYPSPYRLVSQVLAATAGTDDGSDPWNRDELVWPVLDALDASLDEPWMLVPGSFIRGGGDVAIEGRRLEAARKIAGLFHRYDIERPDMIQAWAAGADTGPDGAAIWEARAWQPRLWRQVRALVNRPSLAETLDDRIELIASGAVALDLPDRVCVYGLTAMPTGHVRTLAAIAEQRDVHLFILHPSQPLWQAVADLETSLPLRIDDPTTGLVHHPLLASWGRDTRELQLVLPADAPGTARPHPAPPPDGSTLLHRLQADIRANHSPAGLDDADRPRIGDEDRSIQIHSCHGPVRQVEVLRDAILHLLDADPTLEPRDIIVMCPDVETYAPLVEAAFHPDVAGGAMSSFAGGDAGIPDIRIRIADRAPGSRNPLVGLAQTVVDLAGSRLTSSAVADLLEIDPVRHRFRLVENSASDIAELIADMNVSWGLDEHHRARLGLDGRPERTWRTGIERLLAGAAVSDRSVELMADRLPVAGIEGGDLEAVGFLAELVGRIDAIVTEMAEPKPASEWRDVVARSTALLGDTDRDNDWQWAGLERTLDRLFTDPSGADPTLTRAEVATLLAPLGQTRPSTGNHRTGDLTVSTLVPMRSVPHRVICLLGMDDGLFPRNPGEDGDDLLTVAPRIGTRDPAAEDRQLLLDALLAAEDHLVITYSGRDEHSNAPKPPCVPVAELLDAIDLTVTTADGTPASEMISVDHPLQPFDPRNFEPDRLGLDEPWGFDRDMLAGAVALTARQAPETPLEGLGAVEDVDVSAVALADLRRFFDHPVRAFVERHLGFRYTDGPDEDDDTLAVELDGLSLWAVGNRMLPGKLDGHDSATLVAAERGRDSLPPGNLAETPLDTVTGTIDEITDAIPAAGVTLPAEGTRAIDIALASGTRIEGVVNRISGDTVVTVQYSKVQGKHLIAAWLQLLALTAVDPDTAWRAVVVGRDPGGDGAMTKILGPVADTPAERERYALEGLETLVDLYWRGISEPIPLFGATSYRYAEQGSIDYKVRNEWVGSYYYPGEGADPHHVLVFDRVMALEELASEPPLPDETGAGWPAADSRFEVLALRLWEPILAASGGGE